MKPYSIDLRKKVFSAVSRGENTQAEVAAMFGVSLTFVRQMVRLYRETGKLEAKPHGGGRRAVINEERAELLRQYLAVKPDATLAELRNYLAMQTGITADVSTVCRTLARLGYARKRNARGVDVCLDKAPGFQQAGQAA